MERKWTIYEIIANILCIAFLVGTVVFILTNWSSIPDKVPMHYNGSGEADRWGGKIALLLFPGLGIVLYAIVSMVERHPQTWNTGVPVTEENREKVYRIVKDLLVTTKLLSVAVFAYLSINSALARPLPYLFMPVFMVLMLGAMIFFFIKLRKAK